MAVHFPFFCGCKYFPIGRIKCHGEFTIVHIQNLFLAVLDTNNSLVKMQIFELLSGLSIYSEEGYHLALEALADYKVICSHA